MGKKIKNRLSQIICYELICLAAVSLIVFGVVRWSEGVRNAALAEAKPGSTAEKVTGEPSVPAGNKAEDNTVTPEGGNRQNTPPAGNEGGSQSTLPNGNEGESQSTLPDGKEGGSQSTPPDGKEGGSQTASPAGNEGSTPGEAITSAPAGDRKSVV